MENQRYIYNIRKHGVDFLDQDSGEEVRFDDGLMALIGFSISGQSMFDSAGVGRIGYGQYVQEQTRGRLLRLANLQGTVLKDSLNELHFDCSKFRYWLASEGMEYRKIDMEVPMFFYELTSRDAILAFVKGYVLNGLEEEDASRYGTDGSLRIRFVGRKFADSMCDLLKYVGILPEGYEIGEDYTSSEYACIVEPTCRIPLQDGGSVSAVDWLLGQDGDDEFSCGSVPIEHPRGRTYEPLPVAPDEIPHVEGFVLDMSGFPDGRHVTYDGEFHYAPRVIAGTYTNPSIDDVIIEYRSGDSDVWRTEPPRFREAGSYSMVARIKPVQSLSSEFTASFIAFGWDVEKRKARIVGVPKTVTHDGEWHTLSEADVEPIGGIQESGLASSDSLGTVLFEKGLRNIGRVRVGIKSFDIGRTVEGRWNSMLRNYDCTIQGADIEIVPESEEPPVPQEELHFGNGKDAGRLEIGTGQSVGYFMPIRRVDIGRRTFVTAFGLDVESIKDLNGNDVPEATADIRIAVMGEGELHPETEEIRYYDTCQLGVGMNVFQSNVPFLVDALNIHNLFIDILPVSEDIVLTLRLVGFDNGNIGEHTRTVRNNVISETDSIPTMVFYRDAISPSSPNITFIDSANRSISGKIPVASAMIGPTSSDGALSVSCFGLLKDDIKGSGSLDAMGFMARILSPVGTYPIAITVRTATMPREEYSSDRLPLDEMEYFGEVTFNEPLSGQEMKITRTGETVRLPDENEVLVIRTEAQVGAGICSFFAGDVRLSEDASNGSCMSDGTVSSAFSVDEEHADIVRIASRPCISMYWNMEDGGEEEIREEPKSVCCAWVPDGLPEGEPEGGSYPDMSGLGFRLAGTQCGIEDLGGTKWFESLGFSVEPEDFGDNLENVRRMSLSMCVVSEDGGISIDFGESLGTADIDCSMNPDSDIYRSVSLSVPVGGKGGAFSLDIAGKNGGKVWLKGVVLLVDYVA